jgi:hypothetical protein
LDEVWTAELRRVARPPDRSTTDQLRGLVGELNDGLAEICSRAVAVGELLSKLNEDDFAQALSALDEAMRRGEERSILQLPGVEGAASIRAAAIAACNYINSHAAGEAALMRTQLEELRRGQPPAGEFRPPFKCALFLLILAAGAIAMIGIGGPAGYVVLGVAGQCASALIAWQDSNCPAFLATLQAEPQVQPAPPAPAPAPVSGATRLDLRELFLAVVSLSLLPYLSRDTARSLGRWAVVAPGVALALAIFGALLIYLEWQPIPRTDRSSIRERAAAALLLTLVVGAALNTYTVATVWLDPPQSQKSLKFGTGNPKPPRGSTKSNLNDIAALPGVIQFAQAAHEKALPTAPDLTVMLPYIRGMLSRSRCAVLPNPTDPVFTDGFMCTLKRSSSPSWPECHFLWSLSPVYTRGALATVSGRDDVVTKFKRGGYGKYMPPGVARSTLPYVGVASVGCPSGAGKPGTANLRVAFVLSNASQIATYHSAFRTIGFDWIDTDYLPAPYIAELFSLVSLYRVTQIIGTDRTAFRDTMTSSAQDALLDAEALKALRGLQGDVRVGNRSDGQLGNSRGSCLLAAAAAGLTKDSVRVHVAPSVVTPDLSIADRSLVLIPPTNELISLPCTLVSALVTRNMAQAKNYPGQLTGTQLSYQTDSGESKQDAQRAAYNVRAAGLTLYLLGFDVAYDAAARPGQVVGYWPRSEFIRPSTP